MSTAPILPPPSYEEGCSDQAGKAGNGPSFISVPSVPPPGYSDVVHVDVDAGEDQEREFSAYEDIAQRANFGHSTSYRRLSEQVESLKKITRHFVNFVCLVVLICFFCQKAVLSLYRSKLGYLFKPANFTVVDNLCYCLNGTAANGETCPTPVSEIGGYYCKDCDEGFSLNGTGPGDYILEVGYNGLGNRECVLVK